MAAWPSSSAPTLTKRVDLTFLVFSGLSASGAGTDFRNDDDNDDPQLLMSNPESKQRLALTKRAPHYKTVASLGSPEPEGLPTSPLGEPAVKRGRRRTQFDACSADPAGPAVKRGRRRTQCDACSADPAGQSATDASSKAKPGVLGAAHSRLRAGRCRRDEGNGLFDANQKPKPEELSFPHPWPLWPSAPAGLWPTALATIHSSEPRPPAATWPSSSAQTLTERFDFTFNALSGLSESCAGTNLRRDDDDDDLLMLLMTNPGSKHCLALTKPALYYDAVASFGSNWPRAMGLSSSGGSATAAWATLVANLGPLARDLARPASDICSAAVSCGLLDQPNAGLGSGAAAGLGAGVIVLLVVSFFVGRRTS